MLNTMKEINFSSDHYQIIDWHDLVSQFFLNFMPNKNILLLNNHYFLMPNHFENINQIYLLSKQGFFLLDMQNIIDIPNAYLNKNDIKIKKLVNKTELIVQDHLYDKACLSFLKLMFEKINQILSYTFFHLKNRQHNHASLLQIDTIKLALANIDCQLHAVQHSENEQACFTLSNYLLNALHELAKLGGGRSLLKGHAIEGMFYLKLFQSIYLR